MLSEHLLQRAIGLAERSPALPGDTERTRTLLGITGAPGVGKSTLAGELCRELTGRGARVVLVGMDGFHLAHRALIELGLVEVKGAPETFDVAGYVGLLRRLRSADGGTVWAPEFRREIEDPVAGAVPVHPDVTLVVTEGNYLLLDGPWRPVRALLDEVWFVDVPTDLRHERLAGRHRFHGRTEAQAWERALGSDERNAQTVLSTRAGADVVITPTDR
ncbi:MAG: nucleoside/nucleotide kinase family protein [Pseudonocardiales bacterium]|nr:nucleoside/nucleotide kinase family protein [Pseudonocardiales bacterium]